MFVSRVTSSQNYQPTTKFGSHCVAIEPNAAYPYQIRFPSHALQVTLRGRELPDDDAAHGERFLMHMGQDGRMLVFCANTKLAAMHRSEYLVCDGTFEMASNSASCPVSRRCRVKRHLYVLPPVLLLLLRYMYGPYAHRSP